jgi:hypothetical protein
MTSSRWLKRVSLVVALLVLTLPSMSRAEERWLLGTRDRQVLSVHASWNDCLRTQQARMQTLRELTRREREANNPPPEIMSSYTCFREVEPSYPRGRRQAPQPPQRPPTGRGYCGRRPPRRKTTSGSTLAPSPRCSTLALAARRSRARGAARCPVSAPPPEGIIQYSRGWID